MYDLTVFRRMTRHVFDLFEYVQLSLHTPFALLTNIDTYIHTIHRYIHTYIHTYIQYIDTYIHTYIQYIYTYIEYNTYNTYVRKFN